MTNAEDARAAVDYGADALGFIFVPESPRFVGRNRAAIDAAVQMPPFVSRVAVRRSLNEDAGCPDDYAFDTLQIYGAEEHAFWPVDRKVILAIQAEGDACLSVLETIMNGTKQPHAFLLDAYHPDKLGGSGETFDWDLAVEAKARFGKPIILAGGLTPENVGDAIAKVRPYAVDVSSGVEAEPGRKDHVKLKAFIRAVHEADRLLGF